MVRTSIVALLVVSSEPALDESKKFEFRGLSPTIENDLSQLENCRPAEEFVRCADYNNKIAGVDASLVYRFYNNRLSSIFLLGKRRDWQAINSAFHAKYGKPCDVSSDTLTNGYGAKFTRQSHIWCFSTGYLISHEFGSDKDRFSIIYHDTVNVPEKAPPKVDF